MRPHLTAEQRQLALRLKARGLSLREIGPQVGCSHQGVALVVRHAPRRPVRRDDWVPGPGWLPLADREEITPSLRAEDSYTAIAARPGKAVSTVSREVAADLARIAESLNGRSRKTLGFMKPSEKLAKLLAHTA